MMKSDNPALADRATIALLVVGTLGVFALTQAAAHLRVDEADSWLFAFYGAQILDGQVLYADAWDNKPPGIYWLNAAGLAIAGGRYAGVIALGVLASLMTIVLLGRIVPAPRSPSARLIVMFLAAMFVGHPAIRGGTNRPEMWVTLCECAVMWLALSASSSSRKWFTCGVCGAAALAFKQTGCAALAAVMLHESACAILHRPVRATHIRRIGVIAAGFGSGTGAIVLALAITSDLPWAWDAIVAFNQHYVASGQSGIVPSTARWPELAEIFGLLLILVGGTMLSAVNQIRVKTRTEPGGLDARLVTWFLAAVYLASIGPGYTLHYFAPAVAAAVAIAGVGIGRVQHQLQENRSTTGWCVFVVWIAFMSIPAVRQTTYTALTGWNNREGGDPFVTADLCAVIDTHSHRTDTIFVWGYHPRVYWDSSRRCAARYIGVDKIGQVAEYAQSIVDDLHGSFELAPPVLLFIQPTTLDDLQRNTFHQALDTAALGQFMRDNYTPIDVNVYKYSG
jgi:4-amino-4-deoxy-L-arabinose transferase-like glycosyltransferase